MSCLSKLVSEIYNGYNENIPVAITHNDAGINITKIICVFIDF